MSSHGSYARKRGGRLAETVALALALSAGLAGSELLARAVADPTTAGSASGVRSVITLPLALLAAWIGLSIASAMDAPGRRLTAALNKAALVSISFTALLIPATSAVHQLYRLLLLSPSTQSPLTPGLGTALMEQAVSLPLLIMAALCTGRWRASREQAPAAARPVLPRWGLPRLSYIVVALSLIGFTVGPAGLAAASTSAAKAATVTATANPCATAPHDTFDVSAINITMTLNRYGVNDPNSFMYVLNSNIAAVRAEEQSGQVSSGLQGNDPIQPLVIRAHEGDCVTVNLTNQTTFGLQAFDQPPIENVGDDCSAPPACDGSLTHTKPGNIGWNVDGLPGLSAADVNGAVGQNPDNTAAPGQTASYTVYLDPALGEGAHVFHSSGDTRQTEGHGLFGTLISEPKGSQWVDPHTLQPLASGWDALIQMPSGAAQPNFREFALIFHEIGDEGYRQILEKPGAACATGQGEIQTASGCELPVVDPFTAAYRPCSKAINYRSECFFERELTQQQHGFTPSEADDYGSYANGDMATPRPEMYVGDPYKIRLINAGSEMGHVFHEHGGAIRWLRNPNAANPDIAGGLEKNPPVTKASIRLDSQTIEPGESYDLETECGGGGCQQAAGDFLFHCHITAHYDAGMVSFIRVFDTLQSGLVTIPGRAAKPQAVTSAGLIGKVIAGKSVVPQDQLTDPNTQVSLESLVEGQLPPQGARSAAQDATVWNWAKSGTPDAPVYLGEPQDTTSWADYTAPNPGQRPQIMFDPSNGRYAYPLLQPHLGDRPPFSPNGHGGAPWLGPTASSTRPDGLCPSNSPVRPFNLTAVTVPIQETNGGVDASGNKTPPAVDPNGELFVLNQDKAGVENGSKPTTPLAIRSDVGDCEAVTLTNEITVGPESNSPLANVYSQVNIHTHFVQFDPEASDGVITGLSFEQAPRPDFGTPGETTLSVAAAAGATQIAVGSTAGLRTGISIEVGQGQPDTEVATKITAINGNTLTLNAPLLNAHASGERTGVEFVQYRWYSDAENGTVFFHDHVDALHSWGHGLFGAHIIEPPGSTFHDPTTGAPISSGPQADIYTTGSAGFGEKGDFREFVLWQHTGLRSTGSNQGCELSSFNMRAAPLIDRDPNAASTPIPSDEDVSVPDGVGNYSMGLEAHEEPAGSDQQDCTSIGTSNDPYVFSSVAHGDPATPLLRAYVGDPVVIRQVGLDERVGDLRITGHRFAEETFNPNGVLTDAGTAGVSEKMDYVIEGGAGGDRHLPGDYLYYSGRNLELESGAWGIFRVMNTVHSGLEALPDRTAPPSGPGFPSLSFTGKAPPAAANGPGTAACPNDAPVRSYDVAIFNGVTFDKGMPGESDAASGGSWAVMYALSSDESQIKAGTKPVVPLVIRANAGDCLRVTLHNDLPTDNFTWTWGSGTTRAGFNVGNVIYDPLQSYGAAIGYDPDTTVAPGNTRLYSYYVDKELGTNLVLNMGNESSWRAGAYGAVIAEPTGSSYADPQTGQPLQSGIFADIFPGRGSPFRENVTIFSDREPKLGHSIMDYYLDSDHSYVDYNEASLTDREPTDQGGGGNNSLSTTNPPDPFPLWQAKSDSIIGGSDPPTPVFEAFPGDPVRWRFANAAGDDPVAFQIAGHSFPLDHGLTGSQIIEARATLAGETFDAYLVNGAGGATRATGDYEYNVGRDPMIKSGDWGIFRVLPFTAAGTTGNTGTTLTRLAP